MRRVRTITGIRSELLLALAAQEELLAEDSRLLLSGRPPQEVLRSALEAPPVEGVGLVLTGARRP